MENSPPNPLDRVINRLANLSLPKVPPVVRNAAIAGGIGLGTLTGSEARPALSHSAPLVVYVDRSVDNVKNDDQIYELVNRKVVDQIEKSITRSQDMSFAFDKNGHATVSASSPDQVKAQLSKLRTYFHSDSDKETQTFRESFKNSQSPEIERMFWTGYFPEHDVYIIDSRFIITVKDDRINAFEFHETGYGLFTIDKVIVNIPESLMDKLMPLYPNNLFSKYGREKRSVMQSVMDRMLDGPVADADINAFVQLAQETIPYQTLSDPEKQHTYDDYYTDIMTSLSNFFFSTTTDIATIKHYIDIAGENPTPSTLLNTINLARGYEYAQSLKKSGKATYLNNISSHQNGYAFEDYQKVIDRSDFGEDENSIFSLGFAIAGLETMGISPSEAKVFLLKLNDINNRANKTLFARGDEGQKNRVMGLTSYALTIASSPDDALEFANLVGNTFKNPKLHPKEFLDSIGEFLFDFNPSMVQMREFIDKIQNSPLLDPRQRNEKTRDKLTQIMMKTKIGSSDPETQRKIDTFFHQHGFAGNIAHDLLSMREATTQAITPADFSSDQTIMTMMARTINRALQNDHSDEFVRKAVEFADAIHRYQDESLHDPSDSLRQLYIDSLTPQSLLKFLAVKGRASDFEAITYTSSFIHSYNQLRRSVSQEEYYQMLEDNPSEANLFTVMLGRYGKLDGEVRQNPTLFMGLIGNALEKYKNYEGFVSEELQSLLVEGVAAGIDNPQSSKNYIGMVIDIYNQYPRYRPLAAFIMSSHRDAFLKLQIPAKIHDYIQNLPEIEKPSPPHWEGDDVKFGLYYVKEKEGEIPDSVPFFQKKGFTLEEKDGVFHLSKQLPNSKKIIIDARFDKPDPSQNYQLVASLVHSFETNDFFLPQKPGSFKDVVIFGGSCRSASDITSAWDRGYNGSQFIANEQIGNPYVNLLVLDGLVKTIEEGGGTLTSWQDVENQMPGLLKGYSVRLPISDRIMFLEYVRTHRARFPDLNIPAAKTTSFQ